MVAFTGLLLVLDGPDVEVDLDRVGLLLVIAGSVLLTSQILISHHVLESIDSRRLSLFINVTISAIGAIGAIGAGILLLTPLEAKWPDNEVDWMLFTLVPVVSLVGVLGFFTGLSMVGPGRTAMIANSEPVFVLALAALVLGETLTPVQLAGAAVVVAAIIVLQLERAQARTWGAEPTTGRKP